MNADVPQIQQNLQGRIPHQAEVPREIGKVCKADRRYCTYFRKKCTSGRSITGPQKPAFPKEKIAQKKFSAGHSSDTSCHSLMRRWILCIPNRITCWKKGTGL